MLQIPAKCKCGRCKKELLEKDAETCWYCGAWLCYDCWDEYGHCGHKKADEFNKKARAVQQPDEEIDS